MYQFVRLFDLLCCKQPEHTPTHTHFHVLLKQKVENQRSCFWYFDSLVCCKDRSVAILTQTGQTRERVNGIALARWRVFPLFACFVNFRARGARGQCGGLLKYVRRSFVVLSVQRNWRLVSFFSNQQVRLNIKRNVLFAF